MKKPNWWRISECRACGKSDRNRKHTCIYCGGTLWPYMRRFIRCETLWEKIIGWLKRDRFEGYEYKDDPISCNKKLGYCKYLNITDHICVKYYKNISHNHSMYYRCGDCNGSL